MIKKIILVWLLFCSSVFAQMSALEQWRISTIFAPPPMPGQSLVPPLPTITATQTYAAPRTSVVPPVSITPTALHTQRWVDARGTIWYTLTDLRMPAVFDEKKFYREVVLPKLNNRNKP